MNTELGRKITNEAANSFGVPDWVEVARQAYNAYGRETSFKNFQGGAMPAWENLPESIRVAWTAQAISTWVERVVGYLGCFLRAYSKGEPTFTIRAQDETAFETILFWMGINSEAPAEKLSEAYRKADLCRQWPNKKAAD